MNPLLLEFFGVIFRWLLSCVGSYLVAKHILTVDQNERFTDEFVKHAILYVPVAGALVLGLWSKYRSRIKFLTGLQSIAGTTEAQVNSKIANGMGATINPNTLLLACVLVAGAAFALPSCATRPPAGTYSTAGLKAFDADQALKDITALSETAVNLNKQTGALHLKDRDTALIRDFALSAGAGLYAYGQNTGTLDVVVKAFRELTSKLSAEAVLNDKLRFVLKLVGDNIDRIGAQ